MNSRSANESIKGYSYQFDRTIVELLESTDSSAEFTVEGVEDFDIHVGDFDTFVQCKYYEGTEYNHSVIKKAIIAMLEHFKGLTKEKRSIASYKLYGYYKSGQEKLDSDFSLDFMKESFLSYKKDGISHHVDKELGLNDIELEEFKESLEININAHSYEHQQSNLIPKLLIQEIPDCKNEDDTQLFYYPYALTAIQSLAILADINRRKITKADFLTLMNKKEILFNKWLQVSLEDSKYAKAIKKKYFSSVASKRPKAARVFAIEVPANFDLGKISDVLNKVATSFSHKEHLRTPQIDRFCPFVLLRGLSADDLVKVKERLFSDGLLFDDGYPFLGAAFHPKSLTNDPTKDNLLKLKMLSCETETKDVFNLLQGTTKQIYDFHINSRMSAESLPSDSGYAPIRINDPHILTEIF